MSASSPHGPPGYACLLAFALVCGCAATTSAPPRRRPVGYPHVGPLVTLPLLGARVDGVPYNHASEASIAADGPHVVIAYVNRHYDDDAGYEQTEESEGFRRVAVAVSHDAGRSFRTSDPAGPSEANTSDPVVRVDANGTFWLVRMQFATGGTDEETCELARSIDHGDSFEDVANDLPCGDKPWMAVTPEGSAVYLAGEGGFVRVDADGHVRARTSLRIQAVSGYADGTGAHFLGVEKGEDVPYRVYAWSGEGEPMRDGAALPDGPFDTAEHDHNRTCASLSRLAGGRAVIIRTLPDWTVASRVWTASDGGRDERFGAPSASSFFATGAVDPEGRLHAMWYESGERDGRLVYARADASGRFHESTVVDPHAVPDGHWIPTWKAHGQSLREYVELAVSGPRAYLVWTRADAPPSRVLFAAIDF